MSVYLLETIYLEPVQDPMQAVWELEELVRRRKNGLRASKLPKGFRFEDLPSSVKQCLDKGNADDASRG